MEHNPHLSKEEVSKKLLDEPIFAGLFGATPDENGDVKINPENLKVLRAKALVWNLT